MELERSTPVAPVAYRQPQQHTAIDAGFVPVINGLNVVGDAAAIAAFRTGSAEVIVVTGTLADGRPAIQVRLAHPAERRVSTHLGGQQLAERRYSPRASVVTAELDAAPEPARRVQEGAWSRLPLWARTLAVVALFAAVGALVWGVVSVVVAAVAWVTAHAVVVIGGAVVLALLLGGTPVGRGACTTIVKVTHRRH